MNAESILSADSHIVEPADFRTRYMDADYAERAPRARTDDNGDVEYVVDGDIVLGSVGAPPSDFFRSQIFLTFQEDKIGLDLLSTHSPTTDIKIGKYIPKATDARHPKIHRSRCAASHGGSPARG